MFQCKDLLSLTTLSQAKVIAGKGGMEKASGGLIRQRISILRNGCGERSFL